MVATAKLIRRRLSGKPFHYATSRSSSYSPKLHKEIGVEDEEVPNSGISRPLSHILNDLSKKVPQSLITQTQSSPPANYIHWHALNQILNLHAPEWSGEVRIITYSADGNSVSVVYHITLYGTDAEPVVGMVVSNKMQKSVVVAVDRLFHHKIYNRYAKRTSRFMAHIEQNQCNIDDRVRLNPLLKKALIYVPPSPAKDVSPLLIRAANFHKVKLIV